MIDLDEVSENDWELRSSTMSSEEPSLTDKIDWSREDERREREREGEGEGERESVCV